MIQFREMKEEDRPTIDNWIEKDPGHQGKMTADFFLKPKENWGVFVIVDDDQPIMFVAQEPDGLNLRLHVQFPPDNLKSVVKGLIQAYPVVEANIKSRGFKAVAFESESRALLKFMRRFGFKQEMRAQL